MRSAKVSVHGLKAGNKNNRTMKSIIAGNFDNTDIKSKQRDARLTLLTAMKQQSKSVSKLKTVVTNEVLKLALSGQDSTQLFPELQVSHRFMIHPHSRGLMIWDAFMAFNVCSLIFLVPLRMALYWWPYSTEYTLYSTIVDIMSMIDVLIHFRTAMKTNNGIVSDPALVAKHYAHTWLAIDMLAAIPVDLFLPSLNSTHRKSLKAVKYFRLPKLLRMARLIRVIRKRARYYGVFVNLIGFSIVWHSLACLWLSYGINCDETPEVCDSDNAWDLYATSMRLTLSLLFLTDNLREWQEHPSFRFRETTEGQLIAGYQGFACVCMCIGLFLIASLLANVASIIESFNGEGQRYQSKLVKFKKELEYFGVPDDIQHQVNLHYEYLWMNRKSFVSMSLLQDPEVSDQIRRNVCLHLFKDVVEQVPFFNKVNDENFVALVCMNLVLRVYMPGDYVFYKGDPSACFYIINQGSVAVLSEGEDDKNVAVLLKGSFFGEIGLVHNTARNNSVVSCTSTELCLLQKEVFADLRQKYAAFDLLVSGVARIRVASNIHRQNLSANGDFPKESSLEESSTDTASNFDDEE